MPLGRSPFSGKARSTGRPMIELENLTLGNAVSQKSATHLAIAQDGDAVRNALYFGQAVGNVDYGCPKRGDALDIDE